MAQIITLDEVRTLLQIDSTDTTKDDAILMLIPVVQDIIITHCKNDFETVGVEVKNKRTISFTNKDSSDETSAYMEDGGANFEEFEEYLTDNSITATTIAIPTTSTITDTAGGFDGIIEKGDIIEIKDSASSDGSYTVKSITTAAGTDTITISETGTLTTEIAGESITITKGVNIRIKGSKYNDGLINFITYTSTIKLIMRSDIRLVTEPAQNVISVSIITGTSFPEGIKLPTANLIGYHLDRKDKSIKSEKIGDYSVTFTENKSMKELMTEFKPWRRSKFKIYATKGYADPDPDELQIYDTNPREVD